MLGCFVQPSQIYAWFSPGFEGNRMSMMFPKQTTMQNNLADATPRLFFFLLLLFVCYFSSALLLARSNGAVFLFRSFGALSWRCSFISFSLCHYLGAFNNYDCRYPYQPLARFPRESLSMLSRDFQYTSSISEMSFRCLSKDATVITFPFSFYSFLIP